MLGGGSEAGVAVLFRVITEVSLIRRHLTREPEKSKGVSNVVLRGKAFQAAF